MKPNSDPYRYLAGYSAQLQDQAKTLVENKRLGGVLLERYPEPHAIRNDAALYDFTQAIKGQYLKKSAPLSKVIFDAKLKVIQHALGQHTHISRVQGSKLKRKNEIRIASLFKGTPELFLRMIVVHELAHIKEKDHNKAFYKLCQYMEPNYHQLELDTRLYLLHLDTLGELYK
jgi:predicted metal-dependent hydrolase